MYLVHTFLIALADAFTVSWPLWLTSRAIRLRTTPSLPDAYRKDASVHCRICVDLYPLQNSSLCANVQHQS